MLGMPLGWFLRVTGHAQLLFWETKEKFKFPVKCEARHIHSGLLA
jgi:hypothetical protein